MKIPENFSIETAAEDFAAPGRVVKCPVLRKGESLDGPCPRFQMHICVNDWTFSVIWGAGAYCTGARNPHNFMADSPSRTSPDAEVMVWKGDGKAISLHGDTVEGWISPASLLAAVDAAERDDEDGIRAALTKQGDNQGEGR